MKVFKEEQRFTQWWLWVIIISITIIPIYGIVQQIILKKPFGDKPMSDASLITFMFFMILFLAFFLVLKLKTKVNEIGIHYQFYPIHLNYKTKNWSEIKDVVIEKYNPILDYGGWGIKSGACNVRGNIGIKIEFKNNKKLLIGTQKENEAKQVLNTYKDKING